MKMLKVVMISLALLASSSSFSEPPDRIKAKKWEDVCKAMAEIGKFIMDKRQNDYSKEKLVVLTKVLIGTGPNSLDMTTMLMAAIDLAYDSPIKTTEADKKETIFMSSLEVGIICLDSNPYLGASK